MSARPPPPGPDAPARPLPLGAVRGFDLEADVVVVGFGAAGGGAAAISTGLVYLGGGTRVQRACGFEDSPEAMAAHVRLAAGARPDEERVRLYCEGSLEHFEWLCALGVAWNDSFHEV